MLSRIQVGGGVRKFWRGVREKGGLDEPPEPPLVSGLITRCFAFVEYYRERLLN